MMTSTNSVFKLSLALRAAVLIFIVFIALQSAGTGSTVAIRCRTPNHNFKLSMVAIATGATVAAIPAVGPTGAYIHIPFCRRRCFYCDFPIQVIGDRPSTRASESRAYTDLIIRELHALIPNHRLEHGSLPQLETVYFGGGTPSLLETTDLERILTTLDTLQGISPDAEITLEVDPGTADYPKLQAAVMCGVNRMSLGIQAFDDATLRACGRAHTASEIAPAVSSVHRALSQQFLRTKSTASAANFNVDLISGLPTTTAAIGTPGMSQSQSRSQSWATTLSQAAATGCTHVSVYDLQVESNTAFGRWFNSDQTITQKKPKSALLELPSEDAAAAMYAQAVQVLTAQHNFEHYEISNYALLLPSNNHAIAKPKTITKSPFRSRHNQKYWSCEPVWGFGLSAAGLLTCACTSPGAGAGSTPSSCSSLPSDALVFQQSQLVRYSHPRTMAGYREWVTAVEKWGLNGVLRSAQEGVELVDLQSQRIQMSGRNDNALSSKVVDKLTESGVSTFSIEGFDSTGSCDSRTSNSSSECQHFNPSLSAVDVQEYVMLRLRTSDGLDFGVLRLQYGALVANQIWQALRPHCDRQLVQATFGSKSAVIDSGTDESSHCFSGDHANVQHARLTDPNGFLMSNDIISDVFMALS